MSDMGHSVERDARGWLRKWGEEHAEGGIELAARQIGDSPCWELSTWLDWTRFGLGLDVEREYGSRTWPDRLHLAVTFGPLTFGAVRTWNDPSLDWPVIGRVLPPAEGDA